MGRESSASIVTRYGLDGQAIDSLGGGGGWLDFPILCGRAWCPPSLLHNGYRVSFPGKKRSERGFEHPILSGVVVKERVELYLYSLYLDLHSLLYGELYFLPACQHLVFYSAHSFY